MISEYTLTVEISQDNLNSIVETFLRTTKKIKDNEDVIQMILGRISNGVIPITMVIRQDIMSG